MQHPGKAPYCFLYLCLQLQNLSKMDPTPPKLSGIMTGLALKESVEAKTFSEACDDVCRCSYVVRADADTEEGVKKKLNRHRNSAKSFIAI
jgi:hypothetical protein